MKNKIILIGIMIIGIIFGTINVHAEEITPQANTSWPVTLTYNDYGYTIEGVELRVYRFNSDNTKTETKEENGITTTITTSEESIKYINDEPTKVINLSPTDYTINPEYKEDKLNNYSAIFIKLNLNITQEKLETLLKEELNQVTDKISYITEIVVNYKLTKAPETYKYFKNINTIKELARLFIPDVEQKDNLSGINITNSQVFNIALLTLDESGNKKLNFESTLSKNSDSAIYSLNYLALSSKEIKIEAENDEIEQMIMFHNYDNIEFLIENFKKIEDDAEDTIKNSTSTNTDNAQVVNVDNTAAEVQKYVYVMSIISIMLGSISIVLVLNKKKIV